ncbi:hypothetical protein BDB00DRAFT_443506 [Zychaea mexicana]|uniref:uncharacterized protein n=1 Tax=Zychaea mexicana TaxID=64656 RepID=UPI0022FDEFA2|nr:uncharacterized protein BDB00DRAFT_443506 [Zychaea mexicana]KAI9498329.1 hypothetical protein BDB00DRAFT_443506 [Zychaea mexicana]
MQHSKTVGVLCVMDPKPMDTKSMQNAHTLLKAAQPRLARELGRTIHEEKLTRAKNAAKMDAENKIKFLADMSHEIRTPMNAVIALTDLLLRERASLNSEQTEHLEVIQTSGHHLLTVINDILDISKINHDPKFKLEHRRFSLRKCMKDALNMARHQASMSQPGKIVYVSEYPAEINDRMPVRQMIYELEKTNFIPPQRPHHSEKTRLPLLWKIDSDVPDILMGDTMRLTQIMLNLCSNAVKFTKDGGVRVRIKRCMPTPARTFEHQEHPSTQTSLKRRYDAKIETMWSRAMRRTTSNDGGSGPDNNNSAESATGYNSDDENDDDGRPLEKAILEISVSDSGIGIPADRLPRLFKSFSQIDISTARRYGGTGLGLAISSTLVNHMGGCLWVESEQEVGSCFALTLPMSIARNHSGGTGAGSVADDATGLESASTSSILASPDSPGLSDAECNISINSALEGDCASISSDIANGAAIPLTTAAVSNHASTTSAASPSLISSAHLGGDTPYETTATTTEQLPQWSTFTPPLRSPATEYSQFLPPSSQAQNNPVMSIGARIIPGPPSSPDIPMDISSCNGDTPATSTSDESNQKPPGISRHHSLPHHHHHPPHPHSLISNNSFSSVKGESNNSVNDDNNSSSSSNNNARNARHSGTKQPYHHHYHQHKKSSGDGSEENIAMLYPIKIMLAEDNVLNQKIAISILKRLGYHDVMVANNGCEVLELMRKVKFDVIFMDLYMPDMDGLEATRAIVAERESLPGGSASSTSSSSSTNNTAFTSCPPNNNNNNHNSSRPLLNVADVYIIALTASASRQDRQICIDAGMNDFISKPFTMMEMKASLKNCVSKRKRRRKQQLEEDHHHHHHHNHQQHDRSFPKDDPMTGVEHTSTPSTTTTTTTTMITPPASATIKINNEMVSGAVRPPGRSSRKNTDSGNGDHTPTASGRGSVVSSKAAV